MTKITHLLKVTELANQGEEKSTNYIKRNG